MTSMEQEQTTVVKIHEKKYKFIIIERKLK